MDTVEKKLAKYLDDLGIRELRLEALSDARQKLPVFIGQAYEFRRASFYGKCYVFLLRIAPDKNPTPAEAAKQADIVRDKLGADALFVLSDLKPFERKRWIEKGVPFVVPGRHFFCPMLLLDFRGKPHGHSRNFIGNTGSVSAPAQVLLLYYLLHDEKDHNLAEWAELSRYSPMTITRARKELEAADLCEIAGQGRSLLIRFTADKKGLWEKAQPLLRSPVARSSHAVIDSQGRPQLLLAGISALSSVTMLADDPEPTFAISSLAYRASVGDGHIIEQPIRSDEGVVIQQWRYAPELLAPDGDAVDRLSLYLSLRDDPDERVQMQLARMMEAVLW